MKPLTSVKGTNLSAAFLNAIIQLGNYWGVDNMVYIPYNKRMTFLNLDVKWEVISRVFCISFTIRER